MPEKPDKPLSLEEKAERDEFMRQLEKAGRAAEAEALWGRVQKERQAAREAEAAKATKNNAAWTRPLNAAIAGRAKSPVWNTLKTVLGSAIPGEAGRMALGQTSALDFIDSLVGNPEVDAGEASRYLTDLNPSTSPGDEASRNRNWKLTKGALGATVGQLPPVKAGMLGRTALATIDALAGFAAEPDNYSPLAMTGASNALSRLKGIPAISKLLTLSPDEKMTKLKAATALFGEPAVDALVPFAVDRAVNPQEHMSMPNGIPDFLQILAGGLPTAAVNIGRMMGSQSIAAGPIWRMGKAREGLEDLFSDVLPKGANGRPSMNLTVEEGDKFTQSLRNEARHELNWKEPQKYFEDTGVDIKFEPPKEGSLLKPLVQARRAYVQDILKAQGIEISPKTREVEDKMLVMLEQARGQWAKLSPNNRALVQGMRDAEQGVLKDALESHNKKVRGAAEQWVTYENSLRSSGQKGIGLGTNPESKALVDELTTPNPTANKWVRLDPKTGKVKISDKAEPGYTRVEEPSYPRQVSRDTINAEIAGQKAGAVGATYYESFKDRFENDPKFQQTFRQVWKDAGFEGKVLKDVEKKAAEELTKIYKPREFSDMLLNDKGGDAWRRLTYYATGKPETKKLMQRTLVEGIWDELQDFKAPKMDSGSRLPDTAFDKLARIPKQDFEAIMGTGTYQNVQNLTRAMKEAHEILAKSKTEVQAKDLAMLTLGALYAAGATGATSMGFLVAGLGKTVANMHIKGPSFMHKVLTEPNNMLSRTLSEYVQMSPARKGQYRNRMNQLMNSVFNAPEEE